MDLAAPEPGLPALVNGRRFDRVLLLDVLEHLPHPEILLREAGEVVKQHGAIIVSVPNVSNVTVRVALLFGKFNYADRGIMDRTHLRFFTLKTARQFLRENGFDIVEEKITVMPVELILGVSPGNFFARTLTRVLAAATALFPGILGYQLMFVVKPHK